MNDALQHYITKHRDEFDIYEPSPAVWNRIQKRKPKILILSHSKAFGVAWKAAAAVAIFAFAFFFSEFLHRNDQQVANNQANKKSEIVIPELTEAEVFYATEVNSRLKELNQFASLNPELVKQTRTDLAELDSICTELKHDLKDNAATEEVVEAMIQNYRTKVQVLEVILKQLKKSNDNQSDKQSRDEKKRVEI